MNMSHTGFIEWGKQSPIVTAQALIEDKQEEINFNKKQWSIAPNSDFSPILQTDEEAKNGDETAQEAGPREV